MWLARSLGSVVGAGPVMRMLPGATAAAAFGIVFLIVAWLVKSEELRLLVTAIRRRRA